MARVLLAYLFVGATLTHAAQQDEPSIQGKSLSEWTKLLRDEKPSIRTNAARALQQLGPKAASASAELVKLLKESDPITRSACQSALQAIGEEAVPAIAAALKEKDVAFRRTTVGILYNLGPKAKQAAPALAEALKDSDPSNRSFICLTLARTGPDGSRVLLEALKGKDEAIRIASIGAIYSAGGVTRESLDAATLAIKDSSVLVRSSALNIAARHGPAGLQVLIDGIKDREPSLRYYAIQALNTSGGAGAKEAVPALREALKDRIPYIRLAAITALGRIGAGAKAALPEMAALCEDQDPGVRDAALGTILTFGREAIPAAEKALKNKDQSIRASVASRLHLLGEPAMEILLQVIKDDAGEVRAAAADSLGALGPKAREATKPLNAALEDREAIVRVAAAAALWRIEEKPGASLRILINALDDPSDGVRERAGKSLDGVGKAAVDLLNEMLGEKEEKRRRLAVRGLTALKGQGGAVVPGLMKALADDSLAVHDLASEGLGQLIYQAYATLTQGLRNQNSRVRAGCAKALCGLQAGSLPENIYAPLRDMLKEKDSLARVSAGHLLAKRGVAAETVLPVLREAMKEDSNDIRRRASAAIASYRDSGLMFSPHHQDITKALENALEDKDLGVRLAAAGAYLPRVIFVTPAYSEPPSEKVILIFAEGLGSSDDAIRRSAMTSLAHLATHAAPAAEALTKALKDRDTFIRQRAAYTLASIGQAAKSAIPALLEMFQDKELVHRQLAVQALAAVGPEAKSAVEPLMSVLEKERDYLLRMSAVVALGRIGQASQPAVPALVKLLKEPPMQPRAETPIISPFPTSPDAHLGRPRPILTSATSVILQALSRIGPGAEAAVHEIALLLKGNEDQRRIAVSVLGSIGTGATGVLLEGLKSQDAKLRALCAETLGGFEKPTDDAVKALIVALEDSDPAVRHQTAFALSRIGSTAKSAAPALLTLLKNRELDADSRALAAQALGEMGEEAIPAIAALIAALKDESAFVRQEAASALGNIGADAKEAKSALTELTNDNNVHVSRAARRALDRIQ